MSVNIIVGDNAIGKTTILNNICKNYFSECAGNLVLQNGMDYDLDSNKLKSLNDCVMTEFIKVQDNKILYCDFIDNIGVKCTSVVLAEFLNYLCSTAKYILIDEPEFSISDVEDFEYLRGILEDCRDAIGDVWIVTHHPYLLGIDKCNYYTIKQNTLVKVECSELHECVGAF